MGNFEIFTDSGCDISKNKLDELNVRCCYLTFSFDEENYLTNLDIELKDFYDRMRSGEISKTSGVNIAVFKDAFEEVLKEGCDILYIGLSSGISGTYNAAVHAADELKEIYKDRKIVCFDTLSASLGMALPIFKACKCRDDNCSIDDTYEAIKKDVASFAHFVTADDLKYLVRGGRISKASAMIGGMLSIKPIIHVDDEGHLIKIQTVNGRKKSLITLAEQYIDNHLDDTSYFISHADSYDDAKFIEDYIYEKTNVKSTYIDYIGPVIGSHIGPGALALFFYGKTR